MRKFYVMRAEFYPHKTHRVQLSSFQNCAIKLCDWPNHPHQHTQASGRDPISVLVLVRLCTHDRSRRPCHGRFNAEKKGNKTRRRHGSDIVVTLLTGPTVGARKVKQWDLEYY